MKEILYIKVRKCTLDQKSGAHQIAETFKGKVSTVNRDKPASGICTDRDEKRRSGEADKRRIQSIEVVRGGSVGMNPSV